MLAPYRALINRSDKTDNMAAAWSQSSAKKPTSLWMPAQYVVSQMRPHTHLLSPQTD